MAGKAWIDHLIYVSHDLNKSINKFSRILGVTPTIGGKHVKWGTYNALFSLNNNCYFEIVAPDPESDIRPTKFLCDTRNEGLITFVAHIPSKYKSMEEFKKYMAIKCEYDIGDIIESERAMASDPNKILKWTLGWPKLDENLLFKNANGVLPLLIDWRSMSDKSLHPSYTTPQGCKLLELNCYADGGNNNDHKKLIEVLYLGLEMEDRFDLKLPNDKNEIAMQCLLSCPNGNVEIVTVRDNENDEVISNDINVL